MYALHGGRRDRLEIAPNLWSGIGLVRAGASTALVGDPTIVGDRLRAYQALGIDTIIASVIRIWRKPTKLPNSFFPRLAWEQNGELPTLPNRASSDQVRSWPAPRLEMCRIVS